MVRTTRPLEIEVRKGQIDDDDDDDDDDKGKVVVEPAEESDRAFESRGRR